MRFLWLCFDFHKEKRMNLKCTFQLQIEILLEAEQTLNWKFCLPRGINYSCPLTGYWGGGILGWEIWAFRQSFLCIAMAVMGALSE